MVSYISWRNEWEILLNQSKYSFQYRSGTVNSNTVNSKFHLMRCYCEIFFYHFPSISCLKCTVNSNFHLIRSKTLLTNVFELTVPDLYTLFSNKNTCTCTCMPVFLEWQFKLIKYECFRKLCKKMTLS